ncbi:MAG: serine/threonine protein phosphatase [Oscillospiraceae bacterium]|jgi:hypothetical protein|nr:serine/threonine protein phosphatase [Oscillospiraceae bacterium]
MNFFRNFIKKSKIESAAQTAPKKKQNRQFEEIENYSRFRKLTSYETALYSALKEAVPVIDAAISKIIRLVGNFKIKCESKSTTIEINKFLENVKTGPCGIGIENFIASYLNQLLTFGTAIGEVIPRVSCNKNNCRYEIAGLYNASLKNIELKPDSNVLKILIYNKSKSALIKNPEFIFVSALNPDPGQIYGNSIMKGLPFMSNIFLKIFSAIGNNWDHVGNARFSVIYKPAPDSAERLDVKSCADQIATEWSRVMSSESSADFIGVGDIDIKVIGADNQVLDSRVPVRQILEQIVSKLSIPPFLLGLSWSTTETMSAQQADLLTGDLEAYRRILNPVINKICSIWLKFNKIQTNFEIEWSYVNFKDELRSANARLLNAKSAILESKF